MGDIEDSLDSVVANLTDQNYAESLAFYRFWFDIGRAYNQTTSQTIFFAIRANTGASSINFKSGILILPTAHLTLRFASDVESDPLLAPHTSGLQNRLCSNSLFCFFNNNLMMVEHNLKGYVTDFATRNGFCAEVNFVAHWANLGYVEEVAIRNHILQSLISHRELYEHQADALIILFKLAGATFEAYVDTSVVDRCFEVLKHRYRYNSVKIGLVQVSEARPAKGSYWVKTDS